VITLDPGTNDFADLFTAPQRQWDTTGATPQEDVIIISLDPSATVLVQEDACPLYLEVISTSSPAPILNSVVKTATGSILATVTGTGTIYLKYRKVGAPAWSTSANTYSGGTTGTIAQTGLDSDNYEFIAYAVSASGYTSTPSLAVRCYAGPDSDAPTPSDLETAMQADITDIILAGPGSRVIQFIEGDGTVHSIRAIVDGTAYAPEQSPDGMNEVVRSLVQISKSSTDGLANPDYQCKVRYENQDRWIESIDHADIPGMHLLTVKYRRRIQLSNKGLSSEEF
jgi:hypothetical protein